MTLTLTKKETAFGWLFLLCQFLAVPFAVSLLCVLLGIYSDTVINLVCFLLNAALALILFRQLLTQSFRSCAGRWKGTVLTALKGLGLYWLVNFAVTWLVLSIEPEFGNVNDQSIGAMLGEYPLLMTLCVIFAAPLAEECLFRGWMFTGLAKKSLPLAYAVTCCCFSAAHIVSYLGVYEPRTLLLCFVQYIPACISLGWAYAKSGSILSPIVIHMAINAIGMSAMR